MTDDQKSRWDRLAKFARHPKTIPHGEIEVMAELIVAADDTIRDLVRQVGERHAEVERLWAENPRLSSSVAKLLDACVDAYASLLPFWDSKEQADDSYLRCPACKKVTAWSADDIKHDADCAARILRDVIAELTRDKDRGTP